MRSLAAGCLVTPPDFGDASKKTYTIPRTVDYIRPDSNDTTFIISTPTQFPLDDTCPASALWSRKTVLELATTYRFPDTVQPSFSEAQESCLNSCSTNIDLKNLCFKSQCECFSWCSKNFGLSAAYSWNAFDDARSIRVRAPPRTLSRVTIPATPRGQRIFTRRW